MKKPLVLICLLLIVSGLFASPEFYPRLWIEGYNPLVYNTVDIYKLYRGNNYLKQNPWFISSFAPSQDEIIDFEQGKVVITTKAGNYELVPGYTLSFDRYFANLKSKSFRKSLFENYRNQSTQTQITSTGLIKEYVLELPSIAVPKSVQKVFGSSAGKLNLDGTEKVTIEVGSTKRKNVAIYETENTGQLDIKMEQETNLRLTGTIGDKIGVNLKYNSKQDEQLFDPNNISIKYTGNEDELIQSIEGGNITLALSGSRYISYSTASKGLFGVTSKLKYKDLDLTLIASTEEGQKNTQNYVGTSQADSTVFRSRDYAPRTMYYLEDPYELYDLYTQAEVSNTVPQGWVNNAVKTDPTGAWIIKNPNLLPENGSVRVYLDDANTTNNVAAAEGEPIYFSESDFYTPYYDELIEGTDYVTDYNSGIIRLNKTIDRRYTIAVKYVRRDGIPVPLNSDAEDGILHAKVIRRRNQEYDSGDPNNVWHYQMRNVYNMNKTNIKNDGFTLNVYTVNVDLTRNYLVPDSLATPNIVTYTDYLRMDSTGDGLINGDDNTVNLTTGLVVIPFLEPFRPLGDGIVYTEEGEGVSYLDIGLYMSVKGKIGRESVDLAQGGILKGSVIVKVNGFEQKENVDYIVDYDFGRITFLTTAGKDPDAKIEIDYEYRSAFEVSSKSLAGVRADWNITDWAKLGGTFIYRSENVADRRPRVGSENIEMYMADLDGTLTFKPAFITRWLNALPLINTTAESRITFSGEIAYTIPNIYGDPNEKRKEAYLDDMESIMDFYPMGVTIGSWSQASKPYNSSLARGRTNWYNPKNIRREQVEDPSTLTDAEKRENVTVLAMKVFPANLGVPNSDLWSWGGVMKYLGNQLDFSQKKYIELMVKLVGSDSGPQPNPILRIDLGDINEDFYTEFGGLNVLNTEDKNNDGVLTLEEDTGLDGIFHGEPGADPNDLASNEIDQYGDYPQINGTEGNRVLDTEDLDGNGVLNTLDRYFSYSFALSDSTFLQNVNEDGWRLYRIPLTDPNIYEVVNNSSAGVPPTLKKVSYGRLIMETNLPAKVLIYDFNIVGNKWEDFYVRNLEGQIIPDVQVNNYNTSYLSGIVNNQKNSSHYVSPEGSFYIDLRRESSESALTLAVENLQPGHQVLLRQRLFDPYNLLSYNKVKFWVYPEAREGATFYPDSLDVVFRVGADSLHYYQIRQRVPVLPYLTKMERDAWIELVYDLQAMTSLKEEFPEETSGQRIEGNTIYSFRGAPTLTNARDIYFGVYSPLDVHAPQPYTGILYINDLRVAEPYEDIGIAKRVSLNSVFADLSSLDIDYEDKSENFNTVIQRGRANTFTSAKTLNINNRYFLNKLFPASWGLDIPISLTRNYTLGIPRFQANSDLLRENIDDPNDKNRQRNESLLYSADFGFSQRTAPKSKILQYTIYRTSLSGRIEKAYRFTPTAADTTLTWRGTLNYNLSLPSDKVSFRLFRDYRLGWFPTTFNNSFTINNTDPLSWNWERRDGVYGWHPRAQTVPTRVFTTDSNVSWGLTSDIALNLRLNSERDLIQEVLWQNFNIGKLTKYVQDLGLNYNPTYLRDILSFTVSGTSRFNEQQRKYYQNTPSGQIAYFESDGSSNRTVRANFTLMNSNLLSRWAGKVKSAHDAKVASQPPSGESKPGEGIGDKPKDEPKEDLSEEDRKRLEEEQRKKDEEQAYLDKLKEMESEGLSDEEKMKLLEEEQRKKDDEQAYLDKLKEQEYLDKLKEQEYYDKLKEQEYLDKIGEGDKPKEGDKPGGGGKKPREKFYLPYAALNFLSKIKNVAATYQNSYVQSYSRKQETPPFLFQLGVPNSVPQDSLDSVADNNTLSLASGVTFSRAIDSVFRYSLSFDQTRSNASNQAVAVTFPDFTVSLLDFQNWVGLGKILTNARLNSGFQYTTRANGDLDWEKPKQETATLALNPLVGFTGTFIKSLSTNLSYSLSTGENTTDMDTYEIIKTSLTHSLNGNLSYSFRSGRGFTVPFTKKKIHIKNELTSSLNFLWEKKYDETFGRESLSQIDQDNTRIAITPSATYQFDANIRGGLTGTWEKTADNKRDTGLRTFRIGVWVEVNL